jgi:pyruvate dehydrogenase E2 component (dihydrolipoamide acetyltransferase)
MDRLRDVVTRARSGRLTRAEMSDPTITVTNLGDLGVESVFGVIYPPQVALVGFGRVVEQPFAENGLLGVRPAVVATLSADHRVSDGLRGGRFLDRISELLQQPEEL